MTHTSPPCDLRGHRASSSSKKMTHGAESLARRKTCLMARSLSPTYCNKLSFHSHPRTATNSPFTLTHVLQQTLLSLSPTYCNKLSFHSHPRTATNSPFTLTHILQQTLLSLLPTYCNKLSFHSHPHTATNTPFTLTHVLQQTLLYQHQQTRVIHRQCT